MNQLLIENLIKNDIDFKKIEAKHFIVAFESLIPQVKKEFEQELEFDLTYENLFEKSFKFKHLQVVLSYLNHLNGVVQNEELRDIYGTYVPQIKSIFQEIFLDKRVYDKVVAFKETLEYKNLSDIRKKIVNEEILNYELNGIHLPEDKKERMKCIAYRMTQLCEKFENNIMDVQNTFEMVLSLEQLKGVKQRSLSNLEPREDGKFLVTEASGIYSDILTYCEIEETRKLVYEQQLSLGVKDNYENTPILKEILELRKEKSLILGYDNYSSFSLVQSMLKKPQEVLSFIEKLSEKCLLQARQENKDVAHFGKLMLGRDMNFHDRSYVIENMKNSLYLVDSEEIRKYFPVQKVLDGIFSLIEEMYDISFVKNTEKSVWHEDVFVFNVLDKNNKDIGLLYLDLYKRKNKEDGAWMLAKESNIDTEFEQQKSITYLVLNIAKNKNEESTIEFDDMITLFHEIGHGLHNILSEVKEEYFSGLSNVEHDAIELPSQFMENFVWDYEVLKKISSHIESGEKLPRDMFDKIHKSQFFMSANNMLRQCIFSYIDMYIHTKEVDAIAFEQKLYNDWNPGFFDSRFKLLPNFSHIFSGGYAAGYYSYKWSEVLSADAFSALKESGSSYVQQKEMVNKFRDIILARGGTRDMLDNFIEFRGREPDVKYLLLDNGID